MIEHLPGAPDGVSTGRDGSFWVALVSPVPPIAKLLKDPVVRALYAWLPQWARPPLKKWGAIVKVSKKHHVLFRLCISNHLWDVLAWQYMAGFTQLLIAIACCCRFGSCIAGVW